MSGIQRISHVGIHVFDLEVAKAFYTNVVGLTVTDQNLDRGMVFMSSHPEAEHHELLLCAGRGADPDDKMLQQISFRVDTLQSLLEYRDRFEREGVRLDMVVSHGNAIGIYFFDPDGNRIEVFWGTGLDAHQVFLHSIDLSLPEDEIVAEVERQVALYRETGVIEEDFMHKQQLDR
jgi:catechol-2,3-dioxygenase